MPYNPITVANARLFLNDPPRPDKSGLICYYCQGDTELSSYFWNYPEHALNKRLLNKKLSFKIDSGHDARDYRSNKIYKRGSVLYKYSLGGKGSAHLDAYLIKPHPKNPSQPRLCKFLSFDAGRYNNIPAFTVKVPKSTGKFIPHDQILKNMSLEHPIFPFQVFDYVGQTGGIIMAKNSMVSKEKAEQFAKVKTLLLRLEQGNPVKGNNFAAAIAELNLPLTLDSSVQLTDKETTDQLESTEERQKKLWLTIHRAYKTDTTLLAPQTAEELVLKLYYLQCQFELDEDVASEIFAQWFEQNPNDKKKIAEFVENLYKIRFDQGRLDLHVIYSEKEIILLLRNVSAGKKKEVFSVTPDRSKKGTRVATTPENYRMTLDLNQEISVKSFGRMKNMSLTTYLTYLGHCDKARELTRFFTQHAPNKEGKVTLSLPEHAHLSQILSVQRSFFFKTDKSVGKQILEGLITYKGDITQQSVADEIQTVFNSSWVKA